MGFGSAILSRISEPVSMTAFAGLLCLGGLAAYRIDSSIRNRQSAYLKSAIKVDNLGELGERLNRTNPLAVVVSGKVQSDDPIKSGVERDILSTDSNLHFVSNSTIRLVHLQFDALSSVTYEGKTEIIYELKDSKGGQYTSVLELASINREVPWYLVDGTETEKVRVVGIQKAIGFDLIAYKREVAGPATTLLKELPFCRELDDRETSRFHVLGVKHNERALKVDSSLKVVGKAVKEDNGDITIQEILVVCQPKEEEESRILVNNLSPWKIVYVSAFAMSIMVVVVGITCYYSDTQNQQGRINSSK